jgi:hypothetical protein
VKHDVDCVACNGNGVAPDGWACRDCDGRGYTMVDCPGGGIDDLCTGDPYSCGLCRPDSEGEGNREHLSSARAAALPGPEYDRLAERRYESWLESLKDHGP